jgi:hypothetical protein
MLTTFSGRPRRKHFVWAAAVLLAGGPAAAADPGFVLDLPGGGSLPGAFLPLEEGDASGETLVWRPPLFAGPLEFHLDEIVGVRSSGAAPAADEASGFRCRLQGGDIVDGELRGLDAEQVELVPPGGEPLKIARRLVSSLVRGGVAGGGYVGPGGLVGWEQNPASSWRDEAGRITTDVANATVARDVGGPARARYDIVLSWRKKPELRLAVGAGDGKGIDPYRIEMLAPGGGEPIAVVVRQETRGGMLEPLELPAGERGRLRLTLFVDQTTGRLAVVVPGVQRVIDIKVEPPKGRVAGVFRLQLISGDVCLERLRVSEWKAADPVSGDSEKTRVSFRDGTAMDGEVTGLDAEGRLLIKTGDGERKANLDELEEVVFVVAAEQQPENAEERVRVVRRSGGVLSGGIVAIREDGLTIQRDGIDRPIVVPLADLHSLVSLRAAEPRPLPGRLGTIAVGDARLSGCLVDAAGQGGGLAWQPRGSLAGSPLAGDPRSIAAEIEYVAKPARVGEAAGGQVEIGGMGAVVNQDDEGLFVVTTLSEDGAALRDGRIEPGDRILAIRPTADGPFLETDKLDLGMVMNLLRGKVGTPLGLRVQQGDGGRPRRVDLRRGLIYVSDKSLLDAALAAHATVAAGQLAAKGEAEGYPSLLVLRSGDVVSVKLERVGAAGVQVRSPTTSADGAEAITVVPSLVRAIELDPNAGSKGLAKTQWERLLTLPRSQQADPPTHMLRLKSGDYLRGRLESVDRDEVTFSVLGQPKRIPRGSVARLIWLHADEIEGLDPDEQAAVGQPAVQPAAAIDGLLVQGIASGGGRTTMVAERLEGPWIVGTSLALGPSRIDTRRIDRLVIGKAIDTGAENLPFSKWRLKLAPPPRALRDEE